MSYDRQLNAPIPFEHPRDKWEWMKSHQYSETETFADVHLHLAAAFESDTDPEFRYRMHDLKEMFKYKPLIGLAGKKHSGKSTIADRLVHTYRFQEFAFADRLKASASLLIHEWIKDDEDDLYRHNDNDKEAYIEGLGKTRRQIWQAFGDWALEFFGDDFLIRGLELDIATHPAVNTSAGVVVSDVRSEAEAAWVRKHGGQILHIVASAPSHDEHRTEAGVKCAPDDQLLVNSGEHGEFVAMAVRKLNEMVYIIATQS